MDEAGIVMIESVCEGSLCKDHFAIKKSDQAPDMFVVVNYGEYDDHGRHRMIGKLGQTDIIENKYTADYQRHAIKYSRAEETHDFRVRTNGYFNIQLFDKELVLFEYLGHVVVNVTDVGLHEDIELGSGRITFEVFHSGIPSVQE